MDRSDGVELSLSDYPPSFLAAVVEHVSVPIFVKKVDSLQYILMNRAAEIFFGLPKTEMLGKTAEEVFPEESVDQIARHDQTIIRAPSVSVFTEHEGITPGNGLRRATSTRIPLFDESGEFTHILIVLEDITERRRTEAEMFRLAMYDPLTDLPNRAAFNQEINAALVRHAIEGSGFAVLSVDLDHFKEVNEVWGHAKGDKLLAAVASRLRRVAADHFISRQGGDELCIILENLSRDEIRAKANEVSGCASKVEVDGHVLDVGLSVGAAIFPEDGRDTSTLLANADAALYRAKSEGRGTARFFDNLLAEGIREKRAMQRGIKLALERDQFRLEYQPQADRAGKIVGFEALARWKHPVRGEIRPDVFIPLAEESNLIKDLGEWVLREACREAASWSQPLSISVNLSPIQLADTAFFDQLRRILTDTGLAPDRLTLELTEGCVISDLAWAATVLHRMKLSGIEIALDDFGTGYSSLAVMHSLPLNKLKLDRRFVADFRRPEGIAVMRAIIGLAHELGLTVLAEGVETEEQRHALQRLDCDELQGYLIGRPQPIGAYREAANAALGAVPAAKSQAPL
jgi:diguanylate cyclase (GGDEF)-like protein/PAS domain S-box-containing protein